MDGERIAVRMRFIVVRRECGWTILDAELEQVPSSARCYAVKASAQAAAYRLNRDRCQNCSDVVKRDHRGRCEVDETQRGIRIDTEGVATLIEWTERTVLAIMQEAVGGWIEPLDVGGRTPLTMYCDEEGLLKPEVGMNEKATEIRNSGTRAYWPGIPIAGPVVLTSHDVGPDGETLGLSEEQIRRLNRRFALGLGEV